jgi:hypothetical protein
MELVHTIVQELAKGFPDQDEEGTAVFETGGAPWEPYQMLQVIGAMDVQPNNGSPHGRLRVSAL